MSIALKLLTNYNIIVSFFFEKDQQSSVFSNDLWHGVKMTFVI